MPVEKKNRGRPRKYSTQEESYIAQREASTRWRLANKDKVKRSAREHYLRSKNSPKAINAKILKCRQKLAMLEAKLLEVMTEKENNAPENDLE